MIPRGAPYIGWSDLIAAVLHTLNPFADAVAARREAEGLWAPNTVAFLSVRSGLDALLQVLALPAGSEVVLSAITIPHVLDIIAKHELGAVPVDIDLDTLAVAPDAIRAAITPNTRALLIAHLFGSRMPMDEIIDLARAHDLLLLEDCAQANDGATFRGHHASTVSMFSFGSIKRQTALGGGLLRFADPALAARVRALQDTYPRQPRGAYLKRIATMMWIRGMVMRPVFSTFLALCRLTGRDHDATLGKALRGFAGGDLFHRLRHQPSAALLAVLARRLRQPSLGAIMQRMAVVRTVTTEYPDLPRPGRSAQHHTHWLFPMMTPTPDALKRHLWSKGFDATAGASNLVSVPAPAGRAAPVQAERFMREVLYLPLYPGATEQEMRAMAHAVRDFGRPAPA